MSERRGILRIHNDDHTRHNRRSRSRQKNAMPFIMSEPIMPKEVEKEIILDAIGSFILSCDTNEANDFIKAVTNRIVTACVMIYGK